MKIQKVGVIQLGVDSVLVDGMGCINFTDGRANVAPEAARALISLGVAFACDPHDPELVASPAAPATTQQEE